MTGSWHAVFVSAAVLNIIAAVMALVVLKPLRNAHGKRTAEGVARTVAAE